MGKIEQKRNVINFQEHIDGSIDRSSLDKIFVEYDAAEDLINLKISSTLEITPERASCVISLLSEALRYRGNIAIRGKIS